MDDWIHGFWGFVEGLITACAARRAKTVSVAPYFANSFVNVLHLVAPRQVDAQRGSPAGELPQPHPPRQVPAPQRALGPAAAAGVRPQEPGLRADLLGPGDPVLQRRSDAGLIALRILSIAACPASSGE